MLALRATGGTQVFGATGGATVSSGGAATAVRGSLTSGGCERLPVWQGDGQQLVLTAGMQLQHEGQKYEVTAEAQAWPNSQCVPRNPATWCESWWISLGPC